MAADVTTEGAMPTTSVGMAPVFRYDDGFLPMAMANAEAWLRQWEMLT
jgi:hypothetical protein